MSLKGNASASQLLRGKINRIDVIHTDTYQIAVANGYKGTVDEWLASLKGEKGDKGDKGEKGDTGKDAGAVARLSSVTLTSGAWVAQEGFDNLYSQVVTIDGITEYSKVDLLPSVEQLAIFRNKDLAFVTENEDGVVTVYAIGDKPTNDYTMQVQITEVAV